MNSNHPISETKDAFSEPKERMESLHRELRRVEVGKSHSYAALVLAGILLVVGLIFLYASFKYDETRTREFRPQSIEFATCIALSSIGAILGVYGGIRLTLQSLTKRRLTKEINEARK